MKDMFLEQIGERRYNLDSSLNFEIPTAQTILLRNSFAFAETLPDHL